MIYCFHVMVQRYDFYVESGSEYSYHATRLIWGFHSRVEREWELHVLHETKLYSKSPNGLLISLKVTCPSKHIHNFFKKNALKICKFGIPGKIVEHQNIIIGIK